MEFKRVKIFLYVGLILFCALIGYFLIWPSLRDVKSNQELLKTKLTLKEKKSETLQEFQRVSKEYKKNSKNIKKIDQLLLPGPDLPLILIQLEALAVNTQVEIKSISFSVLEKSEKGVGILPVNLEVKGGYISLKNFLEAIAKNLNIMEVESITLKTGKGPEAARDVYSFSLKINIYTQALPKVEIPPAPKTEEQENLPTE